MADCFRRLKAKGTIRHVGAELNPAAFGRTIEAIVEVKLNPDTSALVFEAALRHLPQLVSAMLVTDSFDNPVRVACVDRDDRVSVTKTLRRHGVRDTYTRLLLRELQFN